MDLSESAQALTVRERGSVGRIFLQAEVDRQVHIVVHHVTKESLRYREVIQRSLKQACDQTESQKYRGAAISSKHHKEPHFEDCFKKRSQDCDGFGDRRSSYRLVLYGVRITKQEET